METHHQGSPGSPQADGRRSYETCFRPLLDSGCVAGVTLLDSRGATLFQKRIDRHLPSAIVHGGVGPGDRSFCLVSRLEGEQLAAAVKGLSEDGLCRRDHLTCSGIKYRVFGGTPLGVYAVGPGKRLGVIVRALPRVGFLVVFYRRPHLPQQVVPCVESFIDDFWVYWQGVR